MTELQKLKQLLDDLMIAYEQLCDRTLMLETKPVIINECPDGLYIHGWDFLVSGRTAQSLLPEYLTGSSGKRL